MEQFYLVMVVVMFVLVQQIVFNVAGQINVKAVKVHIICLMQIVKLAIIPVKHARNQLLVLLVYHLSIELSTLQLLNVFAIVGILTTITQVNVLHVLQ
jgi:hypothetical protein